MSATTVIDTDYSIETPEGVDFVLQPAGPLVRAVALLIDAILKFTVEAIAVVVLYLFGEVGTGLIMLVIFMMEWFYPVLFEVYRHGQTPGKLAMGIRVVQEDGTRIQWGPSMLRNLVRFVDFLPGGYVVGLITMITTLRFKRLGDLVAGTMVVFVGSNRKRPRALRVEADIKPIRLQESLKGEEQLALMAFTERLPAFSAPRAQALASLLKPLLHVEGEEAVRKVQGISLEMMGMESKAREHT